MAVTVSELLGQRNFQAAKVLYGHEDLGRMVTRISVFDCPIEADDAEIIQRGDAFISGLHQFGSDEEFLEFIRFLDSLGSSCLFITNENLQLFTREADEILIEMSYPVILIPKELSYAEILEVTNNLLLQKNYEMIHELKIDKLLYESLSADQVAELIYSLNPNFREYGCSFLLRNLTESDFLYKLLMGMLKKEDLLIPYKQLYLLILTEENKEKLGKKLQSFKYSLDYKSLNFFCGISRVYKLWELPKAISEANLLLMKCSILKCRFCEKKVLDLFDVLISVKENEQLRRYYQTVCSILEAYDPEGKLELIACIEQFVMCRGSYREVAKIMNQHENTIRYRIRRIQELLHMEEDPIQFHETMSIFVKIHLLLKNI